VQAAEILNEI